MSEVASDRGALSAFHPTVRRWFEEEIGIPTDVQRQAWPKIAAGDHLLVTAPTGSGKTLTAFLWTIDRLLTGAWAEGRVRALYVSPLKALNNDIQRNLLGPLAALEQRFRDEHGEAPSIRVMTRSGDTPGNERQKMVRRPPEILITTPESLNILLASRGGRSMLGGLKTVILDEIHAVAGSKRGTHLITAVDRLVPLADEFQRVALSATIRPLERIARFVGGWRMSPIGDEVEYRRRPVSIVESRDRKRYEIEVAYPAADEWRALKDAPKSAEHPNGFDAIAPPDTIWDHLSRDFKARIRANRSTLLFANSRRTTEKVTRLLNERERPELAYSHHGSLSREIRTVVEQRLKDGRLSAIVATNSLELGIDIGALDEVLLVQTPPTVASALQRIGRAGHGVGETSRGRLYPLFGRDFIDAAVVAQSIAEGAIEEVQPIQTPLDVLAQILLAMTAIEVWNLDELFATLRTSDPYHDLSRRQFDLVVEMLAGRYAASRVRELEPRVSIDRVEGTIRARRGTLHRIYLSGGTIPDRGYFHLRHEGSMAKIGELDEEFVWERSLGDTFALGAQHWRVRQITHNDVVVAPAGSASSMAPFWRAEARNRPFHLSERIGRFLEEAEATLATRRGSETLHDRLVANFAMSPDAAEYLVDLLHRQRAATGTPLPHRRHLVIEEVTDAEAAPAASEERQHLLLHTFWGGRVNRPLAIALAAAWQREHNVPLEIENDNDCILLVVPRGTSPEDVLALVRPDNIELLLRERLERTGFFGARFRENAGRALLLPRSDFRRRVPLWLSRERAKKLFEAVAANDDFPILLETWRTCLHDEFELEPLKAVLGELAAGEVRISRAQTATPSPFAAGLVWKQTNRLMYEDDTPDTAGPGLSRDLLQELVFSSQLRPRLPGELIDRFQRKLHRTYPGYPPRTADDLIYWVHERVAMPLDEWALLLAAIEREVENADLDAWLAQAAARLARCRYRVEAETGDGEPTGAEFVASLESVVRLQRAFDVTAELLPLVPGVEAPTDELAATAAALATAERPSDPADLAAEWIRHYGPFDRRRIEAVFPLDEPGARSLIEELIEREAIVVDHFRADASVAGSERGLEVCDAENLERLLRLLRAEARPEIRARPVEELPLFLAHFQRLAVPGDGIEGLQGALERLFGFPAAAAAWEGELLPARLTPYYPAWLDSLMLESELRWFGCGTERLAFGFAGDAELIAEAEETDATAPTATLPEVAELMPDPRRHYTFDELARSSERASGPLTRDLWRLAWAGRISNTTFASVRRGAMHRFAPVEAPSEADRPAPRSTTPRRRGGGRRTFSRWQATRPFAGDWYVVEGTAAETIERDALDREELNKERARLVVERYGVVFRELLQRELPALQWSRLFRSLRLMELSGEVVTGYFFDGVYGLQFASPEAVRALRDGYRHDVIYWMNATDPASPCGLGLEALKGKVPSRLPSNHLVFHGADLVVVSKRNGSALEIAVPPDHPHLPDYTAFLKVLLSRQFEPVKKIDLETINDEPATTSPYTTRIIEGFHATREQKCVRLRRRY